MKRFRPSMRRVVAVAAAAIAGAAATLLVATPASAHHPIVTGSGVCDYETGTYTVTWKIANSEWDIPGKITELSRALDGVAVDDVVPKDGYVEGSEVVAGTTTDLSLTVEMKWRRFQSGKWHTIESERTGTITLDGDCTPRQPVPDAQFASNCDGVVVTLTNGENATAKVKFVVTGTDGFVEETEELDKGESDEVFVPKVSAGSVVVSVNGQTFDQGSWENPGECDAPSIETASSCTELNITVSNPQNGLKKLGPINLTPSTGEAKTIMALGQGERADVTFPASAGLKVLIDFPGDFEDKEVVWETEQDCAPPTTAPPLAQTGASLGGVMGIGSGLVAAGALFIGAFLFLRRRRATLGG